MTVLSEITYSPVWLTRGLYHVSGGTVNSAYVTGDELVYKLWKTGDTNNSRTIKYMNGVWSDLHVTENPVSVATNNNSAVITFVANASAGNTTHTFNNPFYSGGGGGTSSSKKKVISNFW